jgi:alanine racemase
MSRLGTLPTDLSPNLDRLVHDFCDDLRLEGVMTHLACADDIADEATSAAQLACFRACLGTIAARELSPSLRHACNSAGLVRFRDAHFDMVRPGIALYGAASAPEVALPGLQLAMSVHSRILSVRRVPAGARVSYGGCVRLERDSRLAIVPVGYADGYARSMSMKACMLVRGHRCPVIGNITMDICMVDVTDLAEVCEGDDVTLLGAQERDAIDVFEMARWAGTVTYEVLCGISKRVPRHHER